MKKGILAVFCAAALAAVTLAGCGGGKAKDDKVITVAASAVPHAEILEVARPLLEEQGYTLEVTVFDDYIQPNEVVEAGDFDCNYFQHISYMESFNKDFSTHLVNAGGIHYEPFGIYPGKESDLSALSDGMTIAVPDDTTNEARALLLLQEQGIITLREGVGMKATVRDIEKNPYNVEIVELEAAQIPRTLPDVSFGILNGNYAMQAGLNVATDSLARETEDSEATQIYMNVIAVKEGFEEHKDVQALVEALNSDTVAQYIGETYEGAVVPLR